MIRILLCVGLLMFPALSSAKSKRPLIPVGKYRCAVSKGYKLRSCEVRRDDKKRLIFEMGKGNLIGFKGQITRKSGWILIHGTLTDKRPFGCYKCQPRCAEKPGACTCKELPVEASRRCAQQTVNVLLKKSGEQWKGWMPYTFYWSVYKDGKVVGWKTEGEVYPIVIRR